MILTCPACATSYFVPDAAIGPNGRRVRCKSCGHDWHAVSEDAPLDLAEVAAAVAPASPLDAPLNEEPAAPPPLPQAFRAREQERRRAREAVRQGLAWGLLIVLIMAVMVSAYIWRDSIVARVPGLATAYKAVGIHTNAVGLEFEAENARYAAHDTSRVVVSGALRNIRDYEIVAPPIRISILDNAGREIDHKIIRIDGPPVLPGKVEGFAAILPNPEGRFATASMTFITEPKAKPAAAPKAAPKAAPDAAPKGATREAEAAKAEPAAAASTEADTARTDGLRRIGTLPSTEPPLDNGGTAGVSAGNG